VVRDCSEIHVHNFNAVSRARVLAKDNSNDLALLATEIRTEHVPKWRLASRQGEEVVVFGFPLAGILASGGNATTGNITALTGLQDDSRFVQISAPIQPGNSGGPVFNKKGEVIGVVVAKLNEIKAAAILNDFPQNINFAIKSSVASIFLSSYGIALRDEQQSQPMQTADIVDAAKGFTVFIECKK
jgi:S1-C subfamily serine protease